MTPPDGAVDEGEAVEKSAPLPAPTETCTPTGTKSCELVEVKCAADNDCAKDWTCSEMPGAVSSCLADKDGKMDCPPPPPAEKQCVPPYWTMNGGGFSMPGGMMLAGQNTTGKGEDAKTPTAAKEKSTQAQETKTEAPKAAKTLNASPSIDSLKTGDKTASTPNEETASAAGCQLGAGSSSMGFLPLLMLGWLLAFFRRKAN
jgi:hypothetical protein